MNKRLFLMAAFSSLFLMGCAASKVSSMPVSGVPTHPINAIAIAPDSGILAEAVAVDLSNRGYTVIDSSTTSKMMVRLNLSEIEVSKPVGLTKLKDQGIDALLYVKAVGANDGRPISASARVISTYSGKVISGVTWQNGWGGKAGSIADRSMRKGLSEAAAEITDALVKGLPR
mgnify:CR=1 FL=1